MARQRSTSTSSITCINRLKHIRNTVRPSSSAGEHYNERGSDNMIGMGDVKGMQSFHRLALGRANCPTMRTTQRNVKEGMISRAINRRKLVILSPIAEETISDLERDSDQEYHDADDTLSDLSPSESCAYLEGHSYQEYHDAEDTLSDFSTSGLFDKQFCTSSLKQVTSDLDYESDRDYDDDDDDDDNDHASLGYHSPLKLFEDKLAELQLSNPEQFIDIDEYLNSDIQVVDYSLISCFYPDGKSDQDDVTGGVKSPLKKKAWN